MSTLRDMPAASTSGRVRRSAGDELHQRDEVVGLSVSLYPRFEDLLCELCSVLSTCAADDLENVIARRLDQLALQLGAERCTVGEFSDVAGAGIHMQWLVGKNPTPFIGSEDSWIRKGLAGGQSISISTLDELPAEAVSTRQQLEEMGIRSALWVPIMAEGSAVGGIGLTVMSHELHWPAPGTG